MSMLCLGHPLLCCGQMYRRPPGSIGSTESWMHDFSSMILNIYIYIYIYYLYTIHDDREM